MSRTFVVAAATSAVWMAGFGLSQSMPRSPIYRPPMIVTLNNWPEPCTSIAVGGGEVQFVKVDLGFERANSQNWVRFRLGLDNEAFGRAVQEHVRRQSLRVAKEPGLTESEKSAWTVEVGDAMKPARLEQLYARYEKASFDVTEVGLRDFVVWLLFLLMPPYLLFAVAFAIGSRPRPS